MVLNHIAEYKKAEKWSEIVIKICRDKLGENHLNTARGYNFMAIVYYRRCEYEKAEELYKKVLKYVKKI